MKRKYFYYVLRHPETNEIRYFGRTVTPKRRLRDHIREAKKSCETHKCRWLNSLPSDPLFDIIYEEDCTVEESVITEKTFMRKLMKRYRLTNSWDNCVGLRKKSSLVYQYSLGGEFLRVFENANHASIELGIQDANILRACKKSDNKGSNSAGGYLWLFEKHEKYPFPLIKYNGEKPVIQRDLDGNFIAEYESAREASNKTGIGYKLISRVCKKERKHTYGYRFEFK